MLLIYTSLSISFFFFLEIEKLKSRSTTSWLENLKNKLNKENVDKLDEDDISIVSRIGKGGQGVVDRAFWQRNHVAVKHLKSKNLDCDLAHQSLNEILFLRKFNHPNIVRYHSQTQFIFTSTIQKKVLWSLLEA